MITECTKGHSCKGCYSESNLVYCYPKLKNKTNKCPCKMCLIKGVCIVPCEEHEIFVGELRISPIVSRYIKGGGATDG